MITLTRLAAFMRRDWQTNRSYRFPFLLGLVGAFVILVVLHQVGHLVDASPQAHIGQLRAGYFAYVLVGMAVLGVVNTALQSFASKLRQEQTTGTLEALLATPTSPSVIVLGSAMYELAQALTTGLLMLAVGVTSGVHIAMSPGSLLVALVALVGLVSMFAGLGVALAAFTMVFKRGNSMTTLVVSMLALLGGVYFPVSLLPQPFRWLADILPFTWGLDVLRQALLFGKIDFLRLAGMLGAAVIAVPAALVLFWLAVDHARRKGSLTQY